MRADVAGAAVTARAATATARVRILRVTAREIHRYKVPSRTAGPCRSRHEDPCPRANAGLFAPWRIRRSRRGRTSPRRRARVAARPIRGHARRSSGSARRSRARRSRTARAARAARASPWRGSRRSGRPRAGSRRARRGRGSARRAVPGSLPGRHPITTASIVRTRLIFTIPMRSPGAVGGIELLGHHALGAVQPRLRLRRPQDHRGQLDRRRDERLQRCAPLRVRQLEQDVVLAREQVEGDVDGGRLARSAARSARRPGARAGRSGRSPRGRSRRARSARRRARSGLRGGAPQGNTERAAARCATGARSSSRPRTPVPGSRPISARTPSPAPSAGTIASARAAARVVGTGGASSVRDPTPQLEQNHNGTEDERGAEQLQHAERVVQQRGRPGRRRRPSRCVERMLAVPGPMRGSASMKAVIGTTVQTTASVGDRRPARWRAARRLAPPATPVSSRCAIAAPVITSARQQQAVDPPREAVREDHVGRVGDDRAGGEQQARAVERADARAAEDEHGPAERDRSARRAPAVGALTAEDDRSRDDDAGIGRHQQRDERGVEALRARRSRAAPRRRSRSPPRASAASVVRSGGSCGRRQATRPHSRSAAASAKRVLEQRRDAGAGAVGRPWRERRSRRTRRPSRASVRRRASAHGAAPDWTGQPRAATS